MNKGFCTPLEIIRIEQNFADINPSLNATEAMHEASRCLYCYEAPRIQECPTVINVPSFIKKIASGYPLWSARVVRMNSLRPTWI